MIKIKRNAISFLAINSLMLAGCFTKKTPLISESSTNKTTDSNSGSVTTGEAATFRTATLTFGTETSPHETLANANSFKREGLFLKDVTAINAYASILESGLNSSLRLGKEDLAGTFSINFSRSYIITRARVYAYQEADESSLTVFSEANPAGQNVLIKRKKAPNLNNNGNAYVFGGLDNGNSSPSSSITLRSSSGKKAWIHICKIELTIASAPYEGDDTSYSSVLSEDTEIEDSIETEGYYKGINWSKRGVELKSDLSSVINKNVKTLSYSQLADAYTETDVNEEGRIVDMYSSYTWLRSDFGSSASSEGEGANKEHLIPQSIFREALPMKSDLFHVYPSDIHVNSKRSNYPHAEVGDSPIYTSTNGTKIGSSKTDGYSGRVCEPADEYKGDIARVYFYFVTRYENKLSTFRDYGSFNGTSFPSLSGWAIKLYSSWAKNDPVSAWEKKRNDRVERLQGNRNPFIDHPEAISQIWGQ